MKQLLYLKSRAIKYYADLINLILCIPFVIKCKTMYIYYLERSMIEELITSFRNHHSITVKFILCHLNKLSYVYFGYTFTSFSSIKMPIALFPYSFLPTFLLPFTLILKSKRNKKYKG